MYLYFPDRRYGTDKVALVHGLQAKAGDLLEIDETYAIALGDQISFKELIHAKALGKTSTVVFKQLLRPETLLFIHAFVQHRFCTYASAMPLRTGDISQLVRQHKKKPKPLSRDRAIQVDGWTVTLQKCPTTTGQQLIIFPDLRTMQHVLPEKVFSQPGVIQLHSGLTVVQKAKAFRWIKTGYYHTILSTHAQIFQDFFDLTSIVLIDQHKRRYKSQQDPRYRTPTVVEQMVNTYGPTLQTTGYTLSVQS